MNIKNIKFYENIYLIFLKKIEIECFIYKIDEVDYSCIEDIKKHIRENHKLKKINNNLYIKLFNKYLNLSFHLLMILKFDKGKKYIGKSKIIFDNFIKNKKKDYIDVNYYFIKLLLNDIIYYTINKEYKLAYNLIIENIKLINFKIKYRKGFVTNIKLWYFIIINLIMVKNFNLAYEFLIKLENIFELQTKDKINKNKFYVGIIILCKTRKYSDKRKKLIYGVLISYYLFYDYFKHFYKNKCSIRKINIIKNIINDWIINNKILEYLNIYQRNLCYNIKTNILSNLDYHIVIKKIEKKKTEKSLILENKKREIFFENKIKKLNKNIKPKEKSEIVIIGKKHINNQYLYNYLISNKDKSNRSLNNDKFYLPIKQLENSNIKKSTNKIYLLGDKIQEKIKLKFSSNKIKYNDNEYKKKKEKSFKISNRNKLLSHRNLINSKKNLVLNWNFVKKQKKRSKKKKKIEIENNIDNNINNSIKLDFKNFNKNKDNKIKKNSNELKSVHRKKNSIGKLRKPSNFFEENKPDKSSDFGYFTNTVEFKNKATNKVKDHNESPVKQTVNKFLIIDLINRFYELFSYKFINKLKLILNRVYTKIINKNKIKIKVSQKKFDKIDTLPIYINNDLLKIKGIWIINTNIGKKFYGNISISIIRNKKDIFWKFQFFGKKIFLFENHFLEKFNFNENNNSILISFLKKFFINNINIDIIRLCNNIDYKINLMDGSVLSKVSEENSKIVSEVIYLFYTYIINKYIIIKNKNGYSFKINNNSVKKSNLDNKFLLVKKNYKNSLIEVNTLNKKIKKITTKDIINKNIINISYRKLLFNKNSNNNYNNMHFDIKTNYITIIDKLKDIFLFYYLKLYNNKLKVKVKYYKNLRMKYDFNFDFNHKYWSKLKKIKKLKLFVKSNIINNIKFPNKNEINYMKEEEIIIKKKKSTQHKQKIYMKNIYYYNIYEYNKQKIHITIRLKDSELIWSWYNFLTQEKFFKKINNIFINYKIYNLIKKEKSKNMIFLKYFFKFKNDIFGKVIEFKKNKVLLGKIKSVSQKNFIKFNILNEIDNSFINQKFLRQQYFFINYIENIGNCYIKVIINHSYFSIGIEKIALIKFIISPKLYKIKNYYIILNSLDFLKIFNVEISKKLKYPEKLIKLFQFITKNWKIINCNTYSNLVFSYNKFNNFNKKLRIYYKNDFSTYSLFENNDKYKNYLNKNIRSTKIILKKIIKINNIYLVLNVENHLNDNNLYSVNIYIPFSKRRYYCNLTLYDIRNFSSNFIDEVFENLDENIKNNFFSKRSNNKNKIIWDRILNNINIFLNNKNHLILKIDNFKGILRQIIFKKLKKIMNDKIILVEIYYEDFKYNTNINNYFKQISYQNLNKNYLFIRVIKLNNNCISFNHKINLEEIFTVFEEKLINKFNYDPDSLRNNINWKLLKDVSFLIFSKLSNGFSKQKFNGNFNFVEKIIFGDTFKIKMKINSAISLNVRHKSEYKNIYDIVLFKKIFTLKNKVRILNVLYNEKNKRIKLIIYNCLNKIIKEKNIDEDIILNYIPFFFKKIELKLFKQIGLALYKVFKNKLLIKFL